MSQRYYICGIVGAGTKEDPFRPEIADEAMALGAVSWAACQEMLPGLPPIPGDRFMVLLQPSPSDAPDLHAELAYDSQKNPNGYDYIEVADDGTVSVHAA